MYMIMYIRMYMCVCLFFYTDSMLCMACCIICYIDIVMISVYMLPSKGSCRGGLAGLELKFNYGFLSFFVGDLGLL